MNLRNLSRAAVLNLLYERLKPGDRKNNLVLGQVRITGVFCGPCGRNQFIVVRAVTRGIPPHRIHTLYGMMQVGQAVSAARMRAPNNDHPALDWRLFREPFGNDVKPEVIARLVRRANGRKICRTLDAHP